MTHTKPNDPFADFQPTARDDEDAQSQRMLRIDHRDVEKPGERDRHVPQAGENRRLPLR